MEMSVSYTIVTTRIEQDKRFENRLNELARRCRIGKITYKRSIPALPQFVVYKPEVSREPVAWWQNPVVSVC